MPEPISVIVTYFNERHYVAEALDSVRGQTHPAIEIVVVDDGSIEPLSEFLDVTGVTHIRQENGGDGRARNTGIRNVSHPLIAFLDADDIWPEQRLAILSAELEASPDAAIAYGQVKHFISPELPENVKATLHCPSDLMAGLIPTGMLIRRDRLERIGWFSENRAIHSHMEWLGKVKSAQLDMIGVEDVVLHRRLHETNMSHDKASKRERMLRTARTMIRQQVVDNG